MYSEACFIGESENSLQHPITNIYLLPVGTISHPPIPCIPPPPFLHSRQSHALLNQHFTQLLYFLQSLFMANFQNKINLQNYISMTLESTNMINLNFKGVKFRILAQVKSCLHVPGFISS